MAQKSRSPIICRTSSQLTCTKIECHKYEITTLYEKLREITTEMKSFVIEQILLVKNTVNDKLGNNAQLQEKPIEKYLTEEIRHSREENKTKNCIIQTLMKNQNNLLKHINSIDRSHSEMCSMQYAQSDNFITPRQYIKKL